MNYTLLCTQAYTNTRAHVYVGVCVSVYACVRLCVCVCVRACVLQVLNPNGGVCLKRLYCDIEIVTTMSLHIRPVNAHPYSHSDRTVVHEAPSRKNKNIIHLKYASVAL